MSISTGRELVTSTITPKTEKYYLVTLDNLRDLREKRVLADTFLALSGLLLGAFFSTEITLDATSSNLSYEAWWTLDTLWYVFLAFGVLFLIATVIFQVRGIQAVKRITGEQGRIEVGG